MKNNSVYLLALLFVCSTFNSKAQTSEEYFKTLQKRVNTTGEIPPQTRYNLYVDKMNKLFSDEKWKDEVISMKQIRVEPVDNPSNWYYFISVKTKNCSTPWYMEYNIGDPTFGEILKIVYAPAEYNTYIKSVATYNTLSMDEQDLIVNDMWTVLKKRVQTLIADSVRPYLNQKLKFSIDTIVLSRYPATERESKSQEIWNLMTSTSTDYVNYNKWLTEFMYVENGRRDYLKKVLGDYKTNSRPWTSIVKAEVTERLYRDYSNDAYDAINKLINNMSTNLVRMYKLDKVGLPESEINKSALSIQSEINAYINTIIPNINKEIDLRIDTTLLKEEQPKEYKKVYINNVYQSGDYKTMIQELNWKLNNQWASRFRTFLEKNDANTAMQKFIENEKGSINGNVQKFRKAFYRNNMKDYINGRIQ